MNHKTESLLYILAAALLQFMGLIIVIIWVYQPENSKPFNEIPEFFCFLLMVGSLFSLSLLYIAKRLGADKIYLYSAVVFSVLCALGFGLTSALMAGLKDWANNI